MRNGIIISTLLHASMAALAILGLPRIMTPPVVLEQPIIVELVRVADQTVSQKPPEPEPEQPPPPAPRLKTAPPPPEPAPLPEPEPEPEPEHVKTVTAPPEPPTPKPVKKPPPKAEQVVAPKPVEKPVRKPVKKPKPPVKLALAEPPRAFRTMPSPRVKPKRPQRQFDAQRIAALLDKDRDKKPPPRRNPGAAAKTAKPPPPAQPNPARPKARSQPMTMSEIDAIRYQIEQCWSIPAGARDAENLVVRIKIFLNADGTLAKAPEIVGGNQSDDPFYRTAAESARRAVLKCQPLKNLPADKYSNWREITLTFNPRAMLGG